MRAGVLGFQTLALYGWSPLLGVVQRYNTIYIYIHMYIYTYYMYVDRESRRHREGETLDPKPREKEGGIFLDPSQSLKDPTPPHPAAGTSIGGFMQSSLFTTTTAVTMTVVVTFNYYCSYPSCFYYVTIIASSHLGTLIPIP